MQTCLSEGKGFYFPPCHILDICGFRVLFDIPIDLSLLTVFFPLPIDSNAMIDDDDDEICDSAIYVGSESNVAKRQKINKFKANGLICAEPRYRIVNHLLLWDVSFIDMVLISSPMGMLGLPILTRNKDFSAKVVLVTQPWFICLLVEKCMYMTGFDNIWYSRCMQPRLQLKLGN